MKKQWRISDTGGLSFTLLQPLHKSRVIRCFFTTPRETKNNATFHKNLLIRARKGFGLRIGKTEFVTSRTVFRACALPNSDVYFGRKRGEKIGTFYCWNEQCPCVREVQFPLDGRAAKVPRASAAIPCVTHVSRESAAETAFLHSPLSLSAPCQRYVPAVSEPALLAACISGGSGQTSALAQERTVGIEKYGILVL
jgi:hypothetical protein